MKRMLAFILVILTLPTFAQRSETEYRISRIYSELAGHEQIFTYDSENSTNPICVRTIYNDSNSEYVDSLFYDDGLLIRKNCYERYGGILKLTMYYEYTYNDYQKVRCDVYMDTSYKGFYHLGYFDYVYDVNRLKYIEVVYTDGWGERMDFEYNENNLITKETYSYDYGDGEYIPEEVTEYSYNEYDYLIKEVYSYVYNGTIINESEYIYEYDENFNCVSRTEYYEGELDWVIEYTHDMNHYACTYLYTIAEEEHYVEPTHSYMITGYTEYSPDENGELEIAYVYEYSYDPISDDVEENALAFNIYPNPVNDIINIEGENIDIVELYDIFGRKLFSTNSADNIKIDMSDFANGIYIVNIFSDSKKSVNKIIKK